MDILRFGCPTYIFRDDCAKDLMRVLEGIAEIGFDGVELLGLFGNDSREIRKGINKIGLKVMGDHIPYNDFVNDTKQIIESHVLLGTSFITIDHIPENKLPGAKGFSAAVKKIEEIGRCCNEAGIQLLYHNHGYDLIEKVDGKHRLEVFLDAISPEFLSFQPDIGWIVLGGGDPDYFLEKYINRCPVIHLKDYYSTEPINLGSPIELNGKRGGKEFNNFEFRPTGYGIMNYPKLIKRVLACNPKWIVADHDISYDRDGMNDLKASLEYMKKLVLY